MRKIITLVLFLITQTSFVDVLASKYFYIYKESEKNFLSVDINSITEIDKYKFANVTNRSEKVLGGFSINYLFDCKNKKFIQDNPKYNNQIGEYSYWDHKNISQKPVWKEVKTERDTKVMNYICNY